MKSVVAKTKSMATNRFALTMIVIGVFAALPLLSAAHSSPATTAITIVNNSGREVRHVYLSPTNADNWGPDQLGGSSIVTGGTYTLSNVSCDQANVKVIAEDQDGCFVYQVAACGGSETWTIASDAARDCGN
jgi:hypothetical protein